MGIIIFPGKIQRKAEIMNQNLVSLDEKAASQESRLDEVISTVQSRVLAGLAWGTVENYISNIQLPLMKYYRSWIREQQTANSRFSRAAAELPQVSKLDEDQLRENLRHWESRLDLEYDKEEPSSSVIRRCKGMIKEINIKLRAMEHFVSETNNIYDRPETMLDTLSQAEEKLKGVSYNAVEKKIQYDGLLNVWSFHLRLKGTFPPTPLDNRDIEKSPLELTGDEAWAYLHTQGFSEDELRELDDMGFVGAVAAAAWEEMKNTGATVEDITNMGDLKYGISDVFIEWEKLEGTEDKQFFSGLMKGTKEAYLNSFAMQPYQLSDSLFMVAADYSIKLFAAEDYERLKDFNNALLEAGKVEQVVKYPDGTLQRLPTYAYDAYLEKLNSATALHLQCSAAVLAGMESPTEAHKEAYRNYLNMMNYWSAERMAVYDRNGIMSDYSFRVDHISFRPAIQQFEIDMTRMREEYGVEEAYPVTAVIANRDDLQKAANMNRIHALEKERENLLGSYLTKAGISLGTLAAGHYSAGLSAAVSVGGMLVSGQAGTIAGADSLAQSTIGKGGIKAGNIVGQNTVNYFLQMSAINGQLEGEIATEAMRLFGTGGTCIIDGGESKVTFAGVYHPDNLRALETISTQGVAAMQGWDETQIDAIVGYIKNIRGITDEEIDTCNKILTGGLDFYTAEDKDPDNYRVNVDALRRFSEAENIFENIIRDNMAGGRAWGFEDNVFVNSYGVQ